MPQLATSQPAAYGYRSITLTGNEVRRIDLQIASSLSILSATGRLAIGLLDQNPQEIYAGMTFEAEKGEGFDRLYLQDLSGSTNTVVIAYAVGKIHDRRLTVSGTVNVSDIPRAATQNLTLVAVNSASVPVTISAGVANARERHFKNTGSYPLLIGSGNLASCVYPLEPGEEMVTTSGATFVAVFVGGATSVAVMTIG